MKALLRYLSLKSWRDSSLVAFVLVPALAPPSAIIGATHALRYPMYMDARWSPIANASNACEIGSLMCAFFAIIPAFWVLRPEIASRSVAALALAARPRTIVASMIAYAVVIEMSAFVIAVVAITALTSVAPAGIALVAAKTALSTVAAASFGALAVTISPEPAMIIGGCFGYMILIVPFVMKSKSVPVQFAAGIAIALASTALAMFLLERRCAR